MKPPLILLMLFVFAYLQMGFYFHSLCKRRQAKDAFESRLNNNVPDSDLTRFDYSIVQSKLRWEEEGKEFWLNGQLYDVVKQQVVDGKCVLYCLNDVREEEIVDQQMSQTKNVGHESATKNGKHFQYSLPDVILAEKIATTHLQQRLSKNRSPYLVHIFNRLFNPVAPPPKC